MDQRITLVTLGVADLARSIRFYEALGWRRAMAGSEGVAFFQTGRVALSLYPRHALQEDAGVALSDAPTPAMSIAVNVDSPDAVDRALAEAEAAGARITRPGGPVFWGGHIGYFTDPDGFLWEIAWNPGFPIGADGGITIA